MKGATENEERMRKRIKNLKAQLKLERKRQRQGLNRYSSADESDKQNIMDIDEDFMDHDKGKDVYEDFGKTASESETGMNLLIGSYLMITFTIYLIRQQTACCPMEAMTYKSQKQMSLPKVSTL